MALGRNWSVQDNTDDAFGQLRVDDACDGAVFIAWEQRPDHPCPQEARHAAYLAAAAPEMLRALMIVSLYAKNGMPPESWPTSVMVCVRKAIDKATTMPTPPEVPYSCRPCSDPY